MHHLDAVVSEDAELRNYFVYALCLKCEFVDRFTHYDRETVLEHVLHGRSPQQPTETFLKQNIVFIMECLLMKKCLRNTLSALYLTTPSPAVQKAKEVLVNTLWWNSQYIFSHPQMSLFYPLDNLSVTLNSFCRYYETLITKERLDFYERKVAAIRWCANMVANGYETWLLDASDVEVLDVFEKFLSENV